jgi:hypothetical protein
MSPAPYDEVAAFPLLDAIVGRRSRRFGRGMTIPDGPLAYSSRRPPQPLSDEERALLVFAAAGVTGWNLGIPHTAAGRPDSGANYPLRLVGRTYPSAAGILSSELLISDDSGTYITQLRDLPAEEIDRIVGDRRLEALVEATARHTARIADTRVDLPAARPHVSAHNRWAANRPGTALLVPIVDMTEALLDFVSIYAGDGALLWDPAADRPVGDPDALLARGSLSEQTRAQLPLLETLVLQQGTAETSLMAYNGQLLLQAMGLGGWLFAGVNPLSLLGAHAASGASGASGFGFRFARDERWPLPNPIGLDGWFETLVPPYVTDAAAGVERFIARKFGEQGTYRPDGLGPYRDNERVKALIERYDDATIAYLTSVLADLLERYGRFPTTMPSVLASMYLQAQHVDEDFYAEMYGEGALLETHRRHHEVWHGEPS